MTGIELKVRHRLRHSSVLSVAWSPDGNRLVSAGHPYIMWDPHTGNKLHELNEPWAAFVVHAPVRFTADGRYVVVVSDNANIDGVQVGFGLWNVETGRLERQIPVPIKYFLSGKGGKPWFLPIPGKRQAIVMYITDPGWPILLYDTDTWEVLGAPMRIPEGGARGIAVSPDGRLLAIASHRPVPFIGEPIGRIDLYDIASGKLVRRIDGAHKDIVHHVAFSPDSRLIASGTWEVGVNAANDATGLLESMKDTDPVRMWDVATGRKIISFEGPFPGVSNLEFHPTRPWLAASLGTITGQTKGPEFRIWDWQSGALLTTQSQFSSSAQHIAFSPDGRFVAMAGNNKELWKADRIEIAEIITA